MKLRLPRLSKYQIAISGAVLLLGLVLSGMLYLRISSQNQQNSDALLLDELTSRQIEIRIDNQSVNVKKQTIESWVATKTSRNNTELMINRKKIEQYVSELVAPYNKDPIAQTSRAGTIETAGVAGRRVSNQEMLTQELYEALENSSDKKIVLTVEFTDRPFETTVLTANNPPVVHLANRRYSYQIISKGSVQADFAEFRAQVAETLGSGSGWQAGGVNFYEVSSAGQFDIALTEPAVLGSYAGCGADYSCRSGRLVMINDERWRSAVIHWPGSLRDYRHMVVNHEVGHWLGFGHQVCPAAGQPASIMQQQSISLQGCTANPWPTVADLARL